MKINSVATIILIWKNIIDIIFILLIVIKLIWNKFIVSCIKAMIASNTDYLLYNFV